MNNWAVVTGGSRGLGKAIATHLIENKIGVISIATSYSDEIDLTISNNNIEIYGDVTSYDNMKKIATYLGEYKIEPRVLFCCAGVGYFDYFKNIDSISFKKTLEVNIDGVANTIRAFSKSTFHEDGKICVVGSIAGYKAFAMGTAYCASKFALVGFCDALRQELQNIGTKVVLINSGLINTQFIANAPDELLKYGLNPDELGKIIVDMVMNEHIDISEVKLRAPGGKAGWAFTEIISKNIDNIIE